MEPQSSSMRALAQQLLASCPTAGSQIDAPVRAIEKLRLSLTKLAGADGYASLLRRALHVASAESPELEGITISAEGRLEGIGQATAEARSETAGGEAAIAILSHLLGLLITFIGEPLTLSLVREATLATLSDDAHSRNET